MTEPSQPADSNQPHSAQPADSNQPHPAQPAEPHQQTPQAPAFGSQPQLPPPAPGQMPPPPPQNYAGQPLQPGQQMQPMQHGGFPAHQQPVAVMPIYARKDPAVMLLASFFIPGLGSMLSERVGKGLGILIAFFISCVLMGLLIGFLTTPVIWILGLVAAFQDAKDWNRAHGFPE